MFGHGHDCAMPVLVMLCSGMQLMKMGPGRSAFLGYGPLATNFAVHVVEDGQDLDLGSGFGHFGIVLPVRCCLSCGTGSNKGICSAVLKRKAPGLASLFSYQRVAQCLVG